MPDINSVIRIVTHSSFSNKKYINEYIKINTKIQSQATVPCFVFPTPCHSASEYENKFSLVTYRQYNKHYMKYETCNKHYS